MGKAGKALKKALQTHGISQNKLATVLGVERSVVFKGFHEQRDPTAETVVEIVTALRSLSPAAARDFVQGVSRRSGGLNRLPKPGRDERDRQKPPPDRPHPDRPPGARNGPAARFRATAQS